MIGWEGDLPPAVVAGVDQWAARCRDCVQQGVDFTRVLLDDSGPIVTATLLNEGFLTEDPEKVALAFAWTMVTLAEQRTTGRVS
jgi:hypothetical protein